MDVTVRRAIAEDAPGLARLRWQWRIEERGEPGPDRDAFLDYFASWTIDHLHTHVPFLAEVDGRLAGMAFLAISDRVPSPARMDRRTGDVQSVYVVPELRSRGVGAQLMKALCQYARDRELVFVSVHSADRAVAFYRRWGFSGSERWLMWPSRAPVRPRWAAAVV
jgi:GNAT superfamily N-acetyltransferase